MSTLSENGAAIYELIQQLMKLSEAQHAFRFRRAQEQHEMMERERERERRFREEEERIHHEVKETMQKLRAKLGVPEASSTAGDFNFGTLFDEFLSKFGMKPSAEPPLK